MPAWSVPREWPGGECFILAGGPSVLAQDLAQLAGRHVIAINSSYATYPDADFLFFGDARWWRVHWRALAAFKGRIVTCASTVENPRLLKLHRRTPPGLSSDPTCVMQRNTSLAGAINFACHLGAVRLVLLGADGKPAADGRTHHHAPHPWPAVANCWSHHRAELAGLIEPLRQRGVTVLNASPGSALDLWPLVDLADCLQRAAA